MVNCMALYILNFRFFFLKKEGLLSSKELIWLCVSENPYMQHICICMLAPCSLFFLSPCFSVFSSRELVLREVVATATLEVPRVDLWWEPVLRTNRQEGALDAPRILITKHPPTLSLSGQLIARDQGGVTSTMYPRTLTHLFEIGGAYACLFHHWQLQTWYVEINAAFWLVMMVLASAACGS